MSYDFDKRNSGGGAGPNGANRSGTAQPLGPGKTTLAGGLVHQQANQGVAPATRAPGAAAGPLHAKREIGGAHEDRHGATPMTGSVTGPSAGDGVAATVLGSTQANELASDDLFTPALVAALQANPRLSIDEVLWQLAVAPPGEGKGGEWQHPSIVQYGRMAPGAADRQDHKKVAVLVGNQNYQSISKLYTPIAEAGTMQGALASRGYQASVHTDRTSADMTSLWGSMVGAANPGDDLVAFYGGHGCAEGLIGVNHGHPPTPPDIFTNGQVSGVVSSATGKGAHIRFVMDSCHAGSAIETIREERQNELAAVASAGGEQLRAAATTGLREAKQRLISLRGQRRAILGELDHAIQHRQTRRAGARASRDLVACVDVRARTPNAFERAADRIWGEYVPLLGAVQKAVGYAKPPPPITDYATLGEQLKYLDDLGAAVAQHTASSTAGAAGAAGPTGAAGPAGGQAAK